MLQDEMDEAQKALPEWAAASPDTRIIRFALDLLVLTHPGHPPMVWREGGTQWESVDDAGLCTQLREEGIY